MKTILLDPPLQKKENNQPIGIFDSGSGGLMVAKALQDLLPNESFIYVADLAHMPYGEKTADYIQARSLAITDWLLQQGCKMIVIACGTATSVAVTHIQRQANSLPVVNAINPAIQFVTQHYQGKTIGLIATQRTIASGIYPQQLAAQTDSISLHCVAAPQLASHIEFTGQIDCHALLTEYLSQLPVIDALILGSTHYSWIKVQVENYYRQQVAIIDLAAIIAAAIQEALIKQNLLAKHMSSVKQNSLLQFSSQKQFYATHASEKFAKTVNDFFNTEVTVCSI